MNTTSLLPIGAVAESAGVSVSAVRYYEQIGLISSVTRVGGKRRFAPETIPRIGFVLRAQENGFTLDEIKTILDDDTGAWRDLVDRKLVELTQRRDRLNGMISMLDDVRSCGCGAVAACPLVAPS